MVLGKIYQPTLAIFYDIGQIFIVVNGEILNKLYRHLVTLVLFNVVQICKVYNALIAPNIMTYLSWFRSLTMLE